MSEDFIKTVWHRLPRLQPEDEYLREVINQDIERKRQEGWSLDDIVKCLRCMEHFNPDMPEEVALERMRQLRLKYEQTESTSFQRTMLDYASWLETHRAEVDRVVKEALRGLKVPVTVTVSYSKSAQPMNHVFGDERVFEVWIEGFAATGEGAPASLKGKVLAKTFREACCRVFKNDNLFNAEDLTYWGCRLFDNEASARKSFG